MAYGIDVKDENDEVLTGIDAGLQGTRELVVAGGFLVDYFPFLRHLPSFFPGCGFHKLFAKWREDNKLLREMPFLRYKEAIVGLSWYKEYSESCTLTSNRRTTARHRSASSPRSFLGLMMISTTRLVILKKSGTTS